jgi:hypothetical protein
MMTIPVCVRVGPPSVQHAEGQVAPPDVDIVDVGDFELAAIAGRERLGDVEHVAVVHVDTDHRKAAGRVGRLLDDLHNSSILEPRNPETLRLINLFEQDLRPRGLVAELVRGRADAKLNDVVAQDDADLAAVGEVLGQQQRLGDATFTLLVGVLEVADAEDLAVAQQLQEVAGVLAAGDHEDLVDSRVEQGLDRVVDHRPVVDRQQVLVRYAGQGVQPCPQPAR